MLTELIQKGIHELKRTSFTENDEIIICYSSIMKTFIGEEINQYMHLSHTFNGKCFRMFGCEVNENWPYAKEIVIYNKEAVAYNPKLLIKITLT